MATIVGIDVGYGNTKAVWGTKYLNGQKQWNEICIKSVVNQVFGDYGNDQIGGLDRVLVNVNENMYFVGPQATLAGGLSVSGYEYIETEQYEALICGALSYMMKSYGKVITDIDILVLGLPASSYNSKRKLLQKFGCKTRNVPIPVKLQNNTTTSVEVTAKHVFIIPQPYGAIRYAFEIDNNDDLFCDEFTAMVIDPGYSTFDWFVTQGMKAQIELSDSFEGGVSVLLQNVASCISKDYGDGMPNFGLIEKGLQNGYMHIANKKISMDKYLNVIKQSADSIVSEFLRRFDPKKNGINKIILAGGGASFFANSLTQRLPNYKIETMSQSVMSNARGFWIHGNDMLPE